MRSKDSCSSSLRSASRCGASAADAGVDRDALRGEALLDRLQQRHPASRTAPAELCRRAGSSARSSSSAGITTAFSAFARRTAASNARREIAWPVNGSRMRRTGTRPLARRRGARWAAASSRREPSRAASDAIATITTRAHRASPFARLVRSATMRTSTPGRRSSAAGAAARAGARARARARAPSRM